MHIEPLVADICLPQNRSPRSAGVHVSSIIRNMAVERGILDIGITEDLSLVEANQEEWWNNLNPVDRLRMSIGRAWEDWYVPQLGHVVPWPGEMHLDGIYMTHDGESLDMVLSGGYELACHEVKATYKSTKTVGDLRSQWMWLTQTKAYCKGLGTTIAYVHVLFLCGDYHFPIQPMLRCWRIDFSQLEIDASWEMLVGYAKHYRMQENETLWLN